MPVETANDTPEKRRLLRQLEKLQSDIPALRRPIAFLAQDRSRLVRFPLASLLVIGGLFSILPFLGLWMLPLGLLLLAIDVPVLRPGVTGTLIRGRQAIRNWRGRRG
ncbi:tryptophan synthase subunit beta [Cereibacter sphaeroides]|uniref:tryptophan synthase subunit beta n=1 Tax=Cereibacter sphaeroides TaxID=1063 RepID=UPI001F333A44|nr:tryptophan synthase subunit beta [Cereibacter sphaeroides]MCE6958260.1 tryptophan synthase subunit beta [Cereibacter sphaeroides]MCE6971199.1 tryptophan synthase subunit beta [Cereibacter sphaeroides]